MSKARCSLGVGIVWTFAFVFASTAIISEAAGASLVDSTLSVAGGDATTTSKTRLTTSCSLGAPTGTTIAGSGRRLSSGWRIPGNAFFTVDFEAGDGGRIVGAANQRVLAHGSTASVSAQPRVGYRFTGWSGGSTSTDNPLIVSDVTADLVVTANFVQAPANFTIAVTGNGATDPPVGTTQLDAGTTLSVTALPASGNYFSQWLCSGGVVVGDVLASPATVTVTSDGALTAVFKEAVATGDLTMAVSPSGAGTTKPSAGTTSFSVGATTTISASPATGYSFSNWSVTGEALVGSSVSPATTVTLNGDAVVVAVFEEASPETATLTIAASAGGSTSPAPGGRTVSIGAKTSLSAVPDADHYFVSWDVSGGADVGTVNDGDTYVTLAADGGVTANFAEKVTPASLTLAVSPSSAGSLNPGAGMHEYAVGQTIQVRAVSEEDYYFVNWSVTGKATVSDLTSPSTRIVLSGDAALTATFAEKTETVTLTLATSPASDAPGSTNPGAGAYEFDKGAATNVSAVPFSGWFFSHWKMMSNGALSTIFEADTTVILTGDAKLTAVFKKEKAEKAVLTMAVNDAEYGKTNPGVSERMIKVETPKKITAIAADDHHFVHWTIQGKGRIADPYAESTSVTLLGDGTVTAVFQKEIDVELTLKTNVDGCATNPGVGVQSVYELEPLVLTAVAKDGYHFVNWTGDGPIVFSNVYEAETTVVLSGDATATAIFEETLKPVTLTIWVDEDLGSVNPGAGSYSLAKGQRRTICAQANDGQHFVNWSVSGDAEILDVYDPETIVTMKGDAVVKPVFEKDTDPATLALTTRAVRVVDGRLKPMRTATETGGTTNPGTDAYETIVGTSHKVMAIIQPGYYFVKWTLEGDGEIRDEFDTTTRVVINGESVNIIANFAEKSEEVYTLTLSSPGAVGSTNPGAGDIQLSAGEATKIEAVPASGYFFSRWTVVAGDPDVLDDESKSTWVTLNSGNATVTPEFAIDKGEGSVTMTATEGGSTNPGGVVSISYGARMAIQAAPDNYYSFVEWTVDGDAAVSDSTAESTSLTLNSGDAAVTARFTRNVGTLTMAVSPEEGGSTSPPLGERQLDLGVPITISAVAAEGYQFYGWSADEGAEVEDAAAATTTVTLAGDAAVTARFNRSAAARLALRVSPIAAGSVLPTGPGYVNTGETVFITAEPIDGYSFSRWTLEGNADIVDPTSAETSLSLNGDAVVTARFADEAATVDLTFAADPEGSGTIVGADNVPAGSVIDVSAVPATGYRFTRWVSDVDGVVLDPYTADASVVADVDAALVATFARSDEVVSLSPRVESLGRGRLSLSSTIYLKSGDSRPINAYPFKDYVFSEWLVDGDAVVENPLSPKTTVQVSGTATLTGTFTRRSVAEPNPARVKIMVERRGCHVDRVFVSRCLLPLTQFDPTNGATVLIDGVEFPFAAADFKEFSRRNLWRARSPAGERPRCRLTLDLKRNTWSFKAVKANLSDLENVDGVDVVLRIAGENYGFNATMDQFDKLKGRTPISRNGVGSKTKVDGVKRFQLVSDNTRNDGGRLTVSGAEFPYPEAGFDPDVDAVSLRVGDVFVSIPPGSFQAKKSGRFRWRSADGAVVVKLNPKKEAWTCALRGTDLWGGFSTGAVDSARFQVGDVVDDAYVGMSVNSSRLKHNSRLFVWPVLGYWREGDYWRRTESGYQKYHFTGKDE